MAVQLCPAMTCDGIHASFFFPTLMSFLLTGMVDELIMPARQRSATAAAAAVNEWAQAIVEVSSAVQFLSLDLCILLYD